MGERATGQFFFSSSLPVFIGHFPGDPIVPGVHQIAALIVLARLAWNTPSLQLVGITRAKWLTPIAPDVALIAEVTRTGVDSFSGNLMCDNRRCATCLITLR